MFADPSLWEKHGMWHITQCYVSWLAAGANDNEQRKTKKSAELKKPPDVGNGVKLYRLIRSTGTRNSNMGWSISTKTNQFTLIRVDWSVRPEISKGSLINSVSITLGSKKMWADFSPSSKMKTTKEIGFIRSLRVSEKGISAFLKDGGHHHHDHHHHQHRSPLNSEQSLSGRRLLFQTYNFP